MTARAGAISYASPRLCREAREAAEHLATSFNTVAGRLLSARRADAVKLQQKLSEMEKSKAAAEKAFEEASLIIAEYQARLGSLND